MFFFHENKYDGSSTNPTNQKGGSRVADFIFFYVSAASHHFLSPIILEEHIPFLPTFILTERDP